MGKRIELTTVYRSGRVSSPASVDSGATPVRGKSVTPREKRPTSIPSAVVTASPTSAPSAPSGTLGEVGSGYASKVQTLFEAIKHGDEEHQLWLQAAIAAHFAGLPVPPPAGLGRKELIIAELRARLDALKDANKSRVQKYRDKKAKGRET